MLPGGRQGRRSISLSAAALHSAPFQAQTLKEKRREKLSSWASDNEESRQGLNCRNDTLLVK